MIRVTDPARRDEVLKAAVAALKRNGPNRIILADNTMTIEALRAKYYQQDRAMVWLLVAVCIALLVVTALGIVGLASFWVQQRTKQIGVRRALGATRGQILRYFQTENFLLATIGIVLGMMMAYGINQLLMGKYELPRLPAIYLPVGAIALWLLGQLVGARPRATCRRGAAGGGDAQRLIGSTRHAQTSRVDDGADGRTRRHVAVGATRRRTRRPRSTTIPGKPMARRSGCIRTPAAMASW